MGHAADIRRIIDPRLKDTTEKIAITEAIGDVLDTLDLDVTEAINYRSPTATSDEVDVRRLFGITDDGLTGAALVAKIDSQTQIGKVEFVANQIVKFLKANFDFSSADPIVIVTPHGSPSGTTKEDWTTLTVRIPVQDESSQPIPIDDVDLLAEVVRVAPMWWVTVTNSTSTRNAPYIRSMSSPDTYHDFRTEDIIPDEIRASSEGQHLLSRSVKDVEWFETSQLIRRADNAIDGLDEKNISSVSPIQLEVSSTFVDETEIKPLEIIPDPGVLGGFEARRPKIESNGIQAIDAPEKKQDRTFDLTDRRISLGVQPSVEVLDPEDSHPVTVLEAERLVTNPGANRNPTGTELIFHNILKQDSELLTELAGREVRVFVGPLEGGTGNAINIAKNPYTVAQRFVPEGDEEIAPPIGELEVEFVRQFFPGPSVREIDRKVTRLKPNESFEFEITFAGVSAGSTQAPLGNAATAGLTTVDLSDVNGTKGLKVLSGTPDIGDITRRFAEIHLFHAEPVSGSVTIANPTQPNTTYATMIIPVTQNATFGASRNQAEATILGITVQNFFDMINFPAGGEVPGLVDIAWTLKYKIKIVYDLMEIEDPALTGDKDVAFHNFQPSSAGLGDFRCTEVTLSNVGPFRIDETSYVEAQPGWVDDDQPVIEDDQSIRTRRLKYDKNKIPLGGAMVKAVGKFQIVPEKNGTTLQLTAPLLDGYKIDFVTVSFGTQVFRINITDPQIQDQSGGPVFKSVHLDTVVGVEDSGELSLNTIILFYTPQAVTQDTIVKLDAHYETLESVIVSAPNVEDLRSISIPVQDVLKVESFRHNFPKIFADFWTEADTGDILDSPIDRHIGSGVIFFFSEDLPEEGLFAEVFITYKDPGLVGGETRPADQKILSVGVPDVDSKIDYFTVNLQGARFYVDDIGFIHQTIDNNKIVTFELWFDANQIPADGLIVEVFVTYLPPGTSANPSETEEVFQLRSSVFLRSVSFTGMIPLKIRFVTETEGILVVLPRPLKCSAVRVTFERGSSNAKKIMVGCIAEYDKNLKVATFSTRQDWIAKSFSASGSGVTIKRIEAETESEGLFQVGPGPIPQPYSAQRIVNVRVLYYDANLDEGLGEFLIVQTTFEEILYSRFSPFFEGFAEWQSDSGVDEPFLVTFEGVSLNRIDVVGDTQQSEPIFIKDKDYDRPFDSGEVIEPQRVVLKYSRIRRLQFFLDLRLDIVFNPKENLLLDTAPVWKSGSSSSDEKVEIRTADEKSFNQWILDLDPTSLIPLSIVARWQTETGEFHTSTLMPSSTTLAADTLLGDTEIRVADNSGFNPNEIVRVNQTEFVRILRVDSDGQTLEIDPLSVGYTLGDEVISLGRDVGDVPVSSSSFVVEMVKSSVGSFLVKRFYLRLDRRYFAPDQARNVLVDDQSEWATEGAISADTGASIEMAWAQPRPINHFAFEQESESKFRLIIFDKHLGQERPIFLAEDQSERGDIYLDEELVDDPGFTPEAVTPKTLRAVWDEQPLDPLQGDYRLRLRKLIPQSRWDAAASDPLYMLDNSLDTRWLSRAADTTEILSIFGQFETPYKTNRLLLASNQPASLDLYVSNGDVASAFELITTIPDITAPATTVTQSLTLDAGVSEPNPKLLTVGDTAGYIIGSYVEVSDNDSPSEFRKIAGLTSTEITLNKDLSQDFELAQSAQVEQSNILCPGSFFPWTFGSFCLGPHTRGSRDWQDAFAFTLTEFKFFRADLTGIDGQLAISRFDLTRELAIP